MLPGLRLRTYPFQRQLSDVKTTDYLMAIWLRPWLQETGGDDILYHDAGGLVTECPRCNFFIVTDAGTLVTPARNMLKGVTRKQVVELAVRLGIPVEERDLALAELPAAAEAFITASTKRIIPVCRIDDTLLPTPGGMSVTRLAHLRRAVRGVLDPRARRAVAAPTRAASPRARRPGTA
jgi:D-alanine transaminase/branched-chain amino acid aminotransferase